MKTEKTSEHGFVFLTNFFQVQMLLFIFLEIPYITSQSAILGFLKLNNQHAPCLPTTTLSKTTLYNIIFYTLIY